MTAETLVDRLLSGVVVTGGKTLDLQATEALMAEAGGKIFRLCAEVEALKAGAVRVKPLVWRPMPWSEEEVYYFEADTYFGTCGYGRDNDGAAYAELIGNSRYQEFSSPEAAKASAQASYDARILAAIEPDPAALNRIRAEAMREAAAICVTFRNQPDVDEAEATGAMDCAHRILARAKEVEVGR